MTRKPLSHHVQKGVKLYRNKFVGGFTTRVAKQRLQKAVRVARKAAEASPPVSKPRAKEKDNV